jgi:formate hydrogenlyase transcriptional activator
MDLPKLALLLDTSAQLGPCASLTTLGPALFKVLGEVLPVRRVALWLEAPAEGLPVSEWAAELGGDGLLTLVEPLPGWVELTRHCQAEFWDMEQACSHARDNPVLPLLQARGLSSCLLLPLRSPERIVGGLALASVEPGAFREAGPNYLVYLARFIASFALRIVRLAQLDHLNDSLAQERDQQRILLEITNELMEHRDPRDLFQAISSSLRGHLHHDSVTLVLAQADRREARVLFNDFPTGRGLIQENQEFYAPDGPSQRVMLLRRTVAYSQADLDAFPAPIPEVFRGEGIVSLCVAPLISRNRVMGTLNFGSRRADTFTPEAMALLSRVSAQVAIALDNAFAYEEIQSLKDTLAQEKLYLQEEIGKDFGLEMIGESPSFQRVLRQVQTVAGSAATVLILGETGTGKELVARAIHQLSPRQDRGFVQINCASIPMGLVESELFGYEKGAFTGAITPKTGRLELAHEGTLFLDEIGDMPLELQPKLLRAIQERQFERLGSTRTRAVDLRLITATNCDLAAMVEARTFRADLYYRLNVFPIHLPPLRERRSDIPILARYFTQKFAQKMHRPIDSIPTRAMEALLNWDWPGNIRELENVIERSVILSPGRELQVPVAELQPRESRPEPAEGSRLTTLEAAEREHILKALREARGRVGGPEGAAARLGMKRTTLQSRMRKAGIDPLGWER